MSVRHPLTITEAGAMLRDGRLSSVALTTDALARVAESQPRLHAFITITPEAALAAAARADAELAAGQDRGPLHGIPHALKDIYDTAGIRTTCHSRLRADFVPDQDSEVARRLKEAGAVLMGKLATHEFAIGGPSFDLPFPPARNPWNTEHITAGSSSGSGAAVAGGLMRFAMGSDTGGSIRGPAAWCGTVGLKPSYGRVSRRGVFPLSWTLDHCGPLAATIEEAAIVLQAIAGHDPLDPASADQPVSDYRAGLEDGVAGLRLGIPRAFFAGAQARTPEVLAEIDRVAGLLRERGAVVEDVELPDLRLFTAVGRVILTAEAFAIHEADLVARPLEYGRFTFERIVLGATLTAADLVQAQRVRRSLTAAVNAMLQRYDGLLAVGSLTAAPRFDDPAPATTAAAPMQTIAFNVTGHPALAVPTALTAARLPIGVQLVGRAFEEGLLLRIGRAVEQASGWGRKH